MTISAALSSNGKMVCNIVEMEERSFPTAQKALSGSSANSGALGRKASSEPSVTDNGKDVKKNTAKTAEKFSRETYWKPQLNKAEWSLLNDRTAVEIANKAKFLDEATKWLYAKKKDTEVFAIYGIGDGTVPTVLYASGGKKATSDLAQFTSFLKEYDYGTITYAKTAVRWAEIVSSIKRSMYGDYDADGHRRKTLELDGILAEASKRLRKGDNDGSTKNSGNVSYSREPETLNELKRQNKVLRERVDCRKRHH